MRLYLFIILSILLCCCTGGSPDSRLLEIDSLASVSPQEALAGLDSLDYAGLSADNRNLYDLISIKAADKAYMEHTSDSLILKVIDHAKSHQRDLYSEALYYGGRVYSDLGDYPTALDYFQKALESLPDDETSHKLKGYILSQIAWLLNRLRLHSQALPYVRKAISIDSLENNKTSLLENLITLGTIYYHTDSIGETKKCFTKALALSYEINSPDSPLVRNYLSLVYFKEGKIDSALTMVRPLPSIVDSLGRNVVLASAAEIYLGAGKPDTALNYARQIVKSDNPNNKRNGYRIMLSPQVADLIGVDSLRDMVSDYKEILDGFYDRHESQAALMQNSFYNYQLHDRRRIKAEIENKNLWIAITVTLSIMFIGVIFIIVRKMRKKNELILLQGANLNVMKYSEECGDSSEQINLLGNDDPEDLRNDLREKLMKLYENRKCEYTVPEKLAKSKPFQALKCMSESGEIIAEPTSFFKELEDAVLEVSPDFNKNLDLLTDKRLTVAEHNMALLIKCGISPTQIGKLICREKGTISSHRTKISRKIYDKNVGNTTIDGIICLL